MFSDSLWLREIVARLRRIKGIKVWPEAPLAPFTTFGSGGRASVLVLVDSPGSLVEVLQAARDYGIPWYCLGAGSNVLVSDKGFEGIVIKLGKGFNFVDLPPEPGENTFQVAAGGALQLARLAGVLAKNGLSGLEFGAGIPGTVGGAVAMNAGAHGRSMADVVTAVEVVSADGIRWLAGDELKWGYRSTVLPEGHIVGAVKLSLIAKDPLEIARYQRRLLQQRKRTQPRGARTFGSVFKNPSNDFAGRLLEEAGVKGLRFGGAQVSEVHANFIVNVGDATTSDALTVMSLMREAVLRLRGVALEPEVRLLGSVFPWEK